MGQESRQPPVTLSPRRLAALMGRLSEIRHLDAIRLHTRIPVVAPERITPELIAALDQRRAPVEGAPPAQELA